MKLLTIIAAIILFSSCSNDSAQKKAWQDSANMYKDSITKYAPVPNEYNELAESRYKMYLVMYEHYRDKAEGKD